MKKNKWNPDSKTVKRAGGSIKKREFDAVVPSLKMIGKGIMRAYLFYDSEKDRANFIMQYKNGSDEGMSAWAELYESDERTWRLSRIVFLILFIPVTIMAILVETHPYISWRWRLYSSTERRRKMFITILCTIIDFVISKLSPFIILFILFKWYKKMMV